MKRALTLLLAAHCITALGQDTTTVCGYGITSQAGGIANWPYSDIFIPENQKAVSIYADFHRPQYSGSALDFSAAFCAGCSESDVLDWVPENPNSLLWGYDTIPYPMYGVELFFDEISNTEIIGPGYLRVLAPLTQSNDSWNDLCIGFWALSGCWDEEACNYSNSPISDPESCEYTCCPGPGCCLDGQHWDWELNGCVISNPADTNLDGCVQLNDLLDVLSAYGDCGAEEAPWACGDPLSYQGYDYATVQIGDQCWFAENLQAENYRNGEVIPTGFLDSEWGGLNVGAQTIYGEAETCGETYVGIDGCDAAAFLNEVGRLYNWFAVDDPRGLCPAGWHVSSDEDWLILAEAVGGDSTEAYHLKATTGWYSGASSNSSGFTALPGGHRSVDGSDIWGGLRGYWWTSTPSDPNPWHRRISMSYLHVGRNVTAEPQYGFSVRCLKDPE